MPIVAYIMPKAAPLGALKRVNLEPVIFELVAVRQNAVLQKVAAPNSHPASIKKVAAAAITVKLNQGSKEVGLRGVGTRDFGTHTVALASDFKG